MRLVNNNYVQEVVVFSQIMSAGAGRERDIGVYVSPVVALLILAVLVAAVVTAVICVRRKRQSQQMYVGIIIIIILSVLMYVCKMNCYAMMLHTIYLISPSR